MFKILVLLLLCTGVICLHNQNNIEGAVKSENTQNEETTKDSTETETQNENTLDPSTAPVKPKPKPQKNPKLNQEQINMLAEKVMRIHGVEPGKTDEDTQKNIEHLKKVVASVEQNLNQKLKLTQKSIKQQPTSQVVKSPEPIPSQNIQNANENTEKSSEHNIDKDVGDGITDKNEENVINDETTGKSVSDKSIETSEETETLEKDTANIKINSDLPEETEEETVEASETTSQEVENSTDNDEIEENQEETKQTVAERENIQATDDNLSGNIQEESEETTENTDEAGEELNVANSIADPIEVVEVVIEGVKNDDIEPTKVLKQFDNDISNQEEISENHTGIESEGDSTKEEEEDDENDNVEEKYLTEEISETTSTDSVEETDTATENDVVEDETLGKCTLDEGCDQTDTRKTHLYSEEYNSEPIADTELESDIEQTHIQRIIKYVTSFLN